MIIPKSDTSAVLRYLRNNGKLQSIWLLHFWLYISNEESSEPWTSITCDDTITIADSFAVLLCVCMVPTDKTQSQTLKWVN